MNWRIVTFSVVGIAATPFAYLGFRNVFERIMIPRDWAYPAYVGGDGLRDRAGMAHVFLYDQHHVPGKAIIKLSFGMEDTRHGEALQIEVVNGQAFVADRLVPIDDVTDYVNGTHVPYVIVTPVKGSAWSGVFPIIDACRRSSVSVVLLNRNTTL